MTTSSNTGKSSDAVEVTEGMSPSDIEEQPFDINGPAGTDEKKSEPATKSDGLDEETLDDQPFDINGPAGPDQKSTS